MKNFWRKPKITHRVWYVFRRNLLVFRKSWLTSIMFNFLEPLFYLIAIGWGLGAYVSEINGLPYLNWIAPALIVSSSMWATSSECTYETYSRLEYEKTFQAIIATPVDLDEVVLAEIFFGAFKGFLYGSIILLVLGVLGFVLTFWSLLVPLVLILLGIVFAQLSIIWTGIVPDMNSFSYFFTLFLTPMYLFSGLFFPLDALPSFVKILAWFTPLYHAIEIIRPLILTGFEISMLLNICWLLIFSLLLFNFPFYLMRKRLID